MKDILVRPFQIVNADNTVTFSGKWVQDGQRRSRALARTEANPTPESLTQWEARAREAWRRLEDELNGRAPVQAQTIVPMRISDAFTAYLDWATEPTNGRAARKSRSLTDAAERTLIDFAGWLCRLKSNRPTMVHEISRHHIASWRNELKQEPQTVNVYVSHVLSCLRYCWDLGHAPEPPRKLMLPVPRKKHRRMPIQTAAELKTVLDKLDGDWRDSGIILAASGLRQCEYKLLQWTDIDFAEKTLAVTMQDSSTKIHQRTVPLPDCAIAALERIKGRRVEPSGPFVASVDNGFYGLRGHLNNRFRAADTKPHSFRKFYQVSLETLGAPAYTIGDLMGHSQGKVRRSYSPSENLIAARPWANKLNEWLNGI